MSWAGAAGVTGDQDENCGLTNVRSVEFEDQNATDGKKGGPPGEHERRESLRKQMGGVYVKRMSKTGTSDQPFSRQSSHASKLSSSASIATRVTVVSRSEYHIDLQPHIKSDVTINLAFATFVIALGSSYQFGYNIGVLNNPAVLIREFYNETYTERNGYVHEQTVILLWSLTTAFFIPGGMAGAFIGGAFADRIGRKRGILISHIFVIAGAIIGSLCVWAKSPELLMFARILFGINSGIGNCLAPMLLTEIAPFNLRGALGTVHQLAITFGIFMSSVFGLETLLGTKERWPYLMLMETLPAAVSLFILPFLPESPRYLLLLKKEREEAEKALQFYRQTKDVTNDMEEMDTESQEANKAKDPAAKEEVFTVKRLFLDKQLRLPLFIACFLQVIQQFSGINAIFFFSTTIFKASGVPDEQVPYAVIGTNAVNVAMTVISVPLMDKAGRRLLLLIPMIVMVFDLILITIAQVLQDRVHGLAYVSVACVIIYVICFAVGLGPIPMMIGSELFRQGPRPLAMATAGVVNWICTFFIAISFESIQSLTKQYTFIIFLVLMTLFTVFVYIKVPETKNKTFEQIAALFAPGEELEVQEVINDNVFDDLPNDFGDAEDHTLVTINFGGQKSPTSPDKQISPNHVNSDGKRKSTGV